MKLVWTKLAQADRKAIRDFIAQDSPKAALSIDRLLSEQAKLIVQHPEIARLGRVPNTRELVAHKNHILIYDIHADVIRVLRILHATQYWPPKPSTL